MSMKTHDVTDAALDRVAAGDVVTGEPLTGVARRTSEALVLTVPAVVADRHRALIDEAFPKATARVTPMRTGRARRLAALAIAATLSLGMLGFGAVAASASALPGDSLYGVKRAAERLDLAVHGNGGAKARLHLSFAQRRLTELGALLEGRRAGEDVAIGAAMSDFENEVTAAEADAVRTRLGSDFDALLAHVLENLQKHVDRLTFLRDNQVPDTAKDALQRAIDNAEKAKARIGQGRTNSGKPDGVGNGKPAGTPGNGQGAPAR